LLELRVAEHDQDSVGFDHDAGQRQLLLDPPVGGGRNPQDVFGTSVPRPRTWRSIGPRFTVSSQTVARSTLGRPA